MRAGGLRTQIKIIAPPTTRDGYNEVVSNNYGTWSTVTTIWGQLQPIKGTLIDVTQAMTAAANATHTLTIRYNSSITNTCRLAVPTFEGGTKYFTITAIMDENNRHRMMTILCSEPRSNR